MIPDNLNTDFQSFFLKKDSGKYYVEQLQKIIDNNHEQAEKDPELARDFVQRAKGAREALDLIKSISAEKRIK